MLELFCEDGETAREGFRRRMVESWGVVATEQSQADMSLNILERHVRMPPEVKEALTKMRTTWTTPWGDEIQYQLELTTYGVQLAAGLMYRRTWPRNEPLELRREWMGARKEWQREVRDVLKLSRPGMDSPLLCAQAAATGRWESETWERWLRVKDQCKPDHEDVWISDFLARDAAAWGREHVGIIWFEHDALGRKIAELGGFPFYGGGKAAGKAILEEGKRGERTIVASSNAHVEGKNLQKYRRNLITTFCPNGKWAEQLIGRTHRPGSPHDEVEVHVYRHCPEAVDAITRAKDDARFIEETVPGGKGQKLLIATYGF